MKKTLRDCLNYSNLKDIPVVFVRLLASIELVTVESAMCASKDTITIASGSAIVWEGTTIDSSIFF